MIDENAKTGGQGRSGAGVCVINQLVIPWNGADEGDSSGTAEPRNGSRVTGEPARTLCTRVYTCVTCVHVAACKGRTEAGSSMQVHIRVYIEKGYCRIQAAEMSRQKAADNGQRTAAGRAEMSLGQFLVVTATHHQSQSDDDKRGWVTRGNHGHAAVGVVGRRWVHRQPPPAGRASQWKRATRQTLRAFFPFLFSFFLFFSFLFFLVFFGLVLFGSRTLDPICSSRRSLLATSSPPCHLATSPQSVHPNSFFSSSSSSSTRQSIMPNKSAPQSQQQDPNRQATSSHMMKTTKRGRPFLKVFSLSPYSLSPAIAPLRRSHSTQDTHDLFATLIVSLDLTTHKQFFRTFSNSFTT